MSHTQTVFIHQINVHHHNFEDTQFTHVQFCEFIVLVPRPDPTQGLVTQPKFLGLRSAKVLASTAVRQNLLGMRLLKPCNSQLSSIYEAFNPDSDPD